jgi:5-methyltetrahydropteroyltriglutamate--homocysteine methyltransferase
MAVASNLGFPRIGARRELKKALEAHWAGALPAPGLLQSAREVRRSNWRLQAAAGIAPVPTGDFSLYDHVLDTAFTFDLIPRRFRAFTPRGYLDLYFALARGHAGHGLEPLEMTKWFDTNYHYLVPELTGNEEFRLARATPVEHCAEAAALGFEPRPVVLSPLSLWRLAKHLTAPPRPWLERGVAAYADLVRRLVAAGARRVQMDEPILALDLDAAWLDAIAFFYEHLARLVPEVEILLATYFGSLRENLNLALRLPIHALHLDLVRGADQLEAALRHAPAALSLSLGLVDGRNIWKTDLGRALELAEAAAARLTPERVLVAPSCSLVHVPVDLDHETRLAPEIKDGLAFARQKLDEVAWLAKALNQGREAVRAELEANAAALQRRRSSPATRIPQVRSRLAAITPNDGARRSSYPRRHMAQQDRLKLPVLPTTTIGSFPQTAELRRRRRQLRQGEVTAGDYDGFLRREIEHVIRQQETIGLDLLVHGEPERNDMVEYFGERLQGFAFTENGWVQSYGSRYVKPPIIHGDVLRPRAMTVAWWEFAQSLTPRPVKGMLTGPVTILQWSFVRDDQPRRDTCQQLALAVRDECLDLERAGCRAIQIDEPALREGLPLRRAEAAAYLRWAVECFQLASAGVGDATQIHTHMCYADFNDIAAAIAAMDADVISLESARSHMQALDAFASYPNDVGPGVYDIHSPRVPETGEMVELLRQALRVVPRERLWVNPDCGLKTRRWEEVIPALTHMVAAAGQLRSEG